MFGMLQQGNSLILCSSFSGPAQLLPLAKSSIKDVVSPRYAARQACLLLLISEQLHYPNVFVSVKVIGQQTLRCRAIIPD